MKNAISHTDAESKYHQSISDFSFWTILALDLILIGSLGVASVVF